MNKNPILSIQRIYVAIAGAKRAGKDTCAQLFESHGFRKINYGDNLKQMIAYSFDIPLEVMYDDNLKDAPFEQPVVCSVEHLMKMDEYIARTHTFSVPTSHLGAVFNSPRELMQYVGTDIIRAVYPNYHTEVTAEKMRGHDLVVCADVRFPNELMAMKNIADNGCAMTRFFSVYITRPGVVAQGHASETSVTQDMTDYIIENDGSIADLHASAEELLTVESLLLLNVGSSGFFTGMHKI